MTETTAEKEKAEPPAAAAACAASDRGSESRTGAPEGAGARQPDPSACPGPTVMAARSGIRPTGMPVSSGKPAHRLCALVPVYDQPAKLADVIGALRRMGLPVILVDDGSHEPTRGICDRLAEPLVKVVHHPVNQGKGAAVMTGFKTAAKLGYTHALQVDADDQIDLSVVPDLARLTQKFPHALICGAPKFDDTAPASRLWGRRVTNFWCAVNSLSLSFSDAMCGLRVYPLDSALSVCENASLGRRMDFDPEILVRMLWAGVRVKNLPVRVTYPADGVSHYSVWRDTLRISGMHARLFLMMVTRLPIILWSRVFGWAPECRCDDETPQRSARGCPKCGGTRRTPVVREEDERTRRCRHAVEKARRHAERTRAELDRAVKSENAG